MTLFKLIACVPRRVGMSYQDFLDHYRYNHGPLVASLTTFNRHARGYVQNYSLKDSRLPATAAANEKFDGVTELWFDSFDHFKRAYDEPDYMKYLRVDEQAFVTLEAGVALVGDEITVLDGPEQGAPIKLFVVRRRSAGSTQAQFQRQHREAYAAKLTRSEVFKRYVKRYVQDHTMTGNGGLPGDSDYDVVDVLWFQNAADAVSFYSRCEEFQSSLTPDAITIVAEMHTVVGKESDRRA